MMTKKSKAIPTPNIPPEYTLLRLDRLITGIKSPVKAFLVDEFGTKWQLLFLKDMNSLTWGILTLSEDNEKKL